MFINKIYLYTFAAEFACPRFPCAPDFNENYYYHPV